MDYTQPPMVSRSVSHNSAERNQRLSSSEERIHLLRTETERLEQYLRELPDEAWGHPSACDRWTVADVVAHLTWLSQNYPPRITRALLDDASPDSADHRRLGSGQMDPAEEGDQAIALRRALGDRLLSEFIVGNKALDQALGKVGPQDWDKLVYRAVGTESLRNLVDVFITERTVHGWDIRSCFDPQASLSLECVPIIVERIAQRPRWWSFKEGLAPLPLRYRFEVTSPTSYSVDVVVTEDKQFMEVASSRDAQVTCQTDGETYIMLMYGRITPSQALSDGRVAFEGDQALVTAFVRGFTGG